MPLIADILNRLANAPGIAQAGDVERRIAATPVPDWLTGTLGVSPGYGGPLGKQNVGDFVGNWAGALPAVGPLGMAGAAGRVPGLAKVPAGARELATVAPAAGELTRRGFLQQAGRGALGAGAALAGGGVVGKMLGKAGPQMQEVDRVIGPPSVWQGLKYGGHIHGLVETGKLPEGTFVHLPFRRFGPNPADLIHGNPEIRWVYQGSWDSPELGERVYEFYHPNLGVHRHFGRDPVTIHDPYSEWVPEKP